MWQSVFINNFDINLLIFGAIGHIDPTLLERLINNCWIFTELTSYATHPLSYQDSVLACTYLSIYIAIKVFIDMFLEFLLYCTLELLICK